MVGPNTLRRKSSLSSRLLDQAGLFILKEIEAFVPDLVVGDYELSSFSGRSALRIVREMCPDVLFISKTENSLIRLYDPFELFPSLPIAPPESPPLYG
jgi:hypothetical protein